ncbi:TIGR04255 family protein [Tepidiphilus sp. J10]|uniref:TIGR04255 family protein n=1 Tax=Tepidiphilus sp. J10 TaxID=2502185 RepID=UPI001C8F1E00|nr:TIGR04255 family protein [Tepidiphilus sp. J10]
MSERMHHAPVYYALAQAHFNPVAAMSKYVDQIQDRLRLEGYPLYEPQQITELIVPQPAQVHAAEPQVVHTVFWVIARSDRMAGFILTPSSITYHTTRYDTHERFIAELLRGLVAVHDAVTLDHVSRLGLRYLNAVLPRQGERVEQYLARGLHGIEFSAQPLYRLTESVFRTEPGSVIPTGTLVARVYSADAPLGFPPDIQPTGLVIDPKFRLQEHRTHAIIDMDHFAEGRLPIDRDGLHEQLLALHAAIKSVFYAIITDHARNVWA